MDKSTFFENIMNPIVRLPEDIQNEFWESSEVLKLKKGDYSLQQGEKEHFVRFLVKGIIRVFKIEVEKEITMDFLFSGEFVTGYTSFISDAPSPYSLQMLQEGTILKFPIRKVRELLDKSHEFERFARIAAEQAYLKRTNIESELLLNTAEERYLSLLEKNSKLVQEIPVKHIASYLGIAAQSLSRIRSRISK